MTHKDVPEGYKKCSQCRVNKLKSEFYKDSGKFDGLRRMCKTCDRARRATLPNEKAGKPTTEQLRKYNLMKKYGLTVEDYDRLYEEQKGLCAICGDAHDTLSVDHCHESLRVRGLLCTPCNVGLGMFKDNPESLQKAISYLSVC